MPEVARKRRTQPPPPHVLYEALTDPDRDPTRPWLLLQEDEQRPTIAESVEPNVVVWTSLWPLRPDANIRFDIEGPSRGSATLTWTLILDDPVPDAATIIRMRKRLNVLINANLRFTFGQ
ncbi:hypothetical protein O4215_13255 [Rhodococcus maanshanensis]|uniref:hypothetical protein n=1 Tax=Rhodococcus maanshanensis TaxID=183556 RepID=UPI0022B2B861|nr:hypothetical protein [Rhodococcus maanshanensis]MCZ4556540.1 hypothetical protein [Rhodococcus maanshanensis]